MYSLALRNAGRAARPSFAAFSTSARARSDGSHMHGNDPGVIEKEKRRNLENKDGSRHSSSPHDHAPGWNELLASVSEANVKADKSEGSPEEMQQSTVSFLKAKHEETEKEEAQKKQ